MSSPGLDSSPVRHAWVQARLYAAAGAVLASVTSVIVVSIERLTNGVALLTGRVLRALANRNRSKSARCHSQKRTGMHTYGQAAASTSAGASAFSHLSKQSSSAKQRAPIDRASTLKAVRIPVRPVLVQICVAMVTHTGAASHDYRRVTVSQP